MSSVILSREDIVKKISKFSQIKEQIRRVKMSHRSYLSSKNIRVRVMVVGDTKKISLRVIAKCK